MENKALAVQEAKQDSKGFAGKFAKVAALGASLGALAVSTGAHAAAIDTTAVEAAISEQNTSITTVAVAILGVLALIAGIGYIRRVIR